MNPCLQNPCYGLGSTCTTVSSTSFTCTCGMSSVTGPLCKSHYGPVCQCLNGGTCVSSTFNGVQVFDCNCPAGLGYFYRKDKRLKLFLF